MKRYILVAKSKSEKNPKEFVLMRSAAWTWTWKKEGFYFKDMNNLKYFASKVPNAMAKYARYHGWNNSHMSDGMLVFFSVEDAKKMLYQLLTWADSQYGNRYFQEFLKTHYVRIVNVNSEKFPYTIPCSINKKLLNSYYDKGISNCRRDKNGNILYSTQMLCLDGCYTDEFLNKCSSRVQEKYALDKKKTLKRLKSVGLEYDKIAMLGGDIKDKDSHISDYAYYCEIKFICFYAMFDKDKYKQIVETNKV